MKFKLFLYLLFCIASLSAQQPAKVKELEKERLNTLAEIEKINKWLKENIQTTANALNHLNLLAQQIDSRKKVIQILDEEIVSIDNDISSKASQIASLENDLDTVKQQYAASIRKMYLHKNSQDNLLFILSAQNFTQSFHRILYLKAYSNWQRKQAELIVNKQNKINEEKTVLVASRNNKLNLLKAKQSEENQLNNEETRKKTEIKTLEKDKKKLQTDLAKKQKQADALNRQIERIIAEEIQKSEKAAKSKTEGTRTAEIKGGYAMTEKERNLSSTFAGNKGRLPFPLRGDYSIVGYFGVHYHRDFPKIVTQNNGIDIRTTAGNEARVVFNGVVSRIFTLPGYNNCIIVRHGNYMTLYCNLDQVYVKQGDNLTTGQTIGKIYTDTENYTTLHFEIWKEQNKIDPLSWIK